MAVLATVGGWKLREVGEGEVFALKGLLRELARQREGWDAEPSACVIDAQSLKTFTKVRAPGTRFVEHSRRCLTG